MSQNDLNRIAEQIPAAMAGDRPQFSKRLSGLRRRAKQGKPFDKGLASLQQDLSVSSERRQRRHDNRPAITYPEELPVSARRVEIAAAIEEHQVVVVAGETGSGKTTQLPKICLELGRGVDGYIGHTQPRRLAARSVATRIANELQVPPGSAVGYKVRFTDRTSADSYVKLMTDGILLAEIQHDPLLRHYDTIIIDEAHERSLNIDFLLGYLKRLLPKRPDLKVVITSATINTEGFARFFDGAPIIEVSGRTYPVEVRYRPLLTEDEDERDRDLPQAIVDAVEEAGRHDPLGDILIFLPGEREIREVRETLRKAALRHTEVIPLFSRLSNKEQDQVFRPHSGRRIVLATNVAETSLTVPGIKFVIDSGLARISRYSHRTKVQRLPIEPIAQASADQRAGRCGRVSAGVCLRLYSEEDYTGRPRFTDPEIRRTNLASVILQMAQMGLGDVEQFPFMDPPDSRLIKDGYRLLEELQAVDRHHRLTGLGRKLARLPLDPRLGRMLLAAEREGALEEVLVITSALAVQDPRSRPLDAQQKADQRHAEFRDKRSDFIAYLNLWRWYHEQARHLSRSKLRNSCHDRYLSYVRLREWHDIHGQLLGLVKELGLQFSAVDGGKKGRSGSAKSAPSSSQETEELPQGLLDAIHRSLLAGLLSHIGLRDEERQYYGARNMKLHLFPGSGLYKKPPKWLMAAELVETSKLFARTCAAIKPQWLEPLAGHLLKRSYAEPHWEKKPAQVAALETVTLYGLPIVSGRKVNYGPIDPVMSRELFIRHALVEGEYETQAPFFAHNRALIEEVETLEAKARRRDVLVDDETLFQFYDALIPEGIYSGKGFDKWRKQAERDDANLLYLTRDKLMQHEAEQVTAQDYPDHFETAGLQLKLDYHFDPSHHADGITVEVPVAALGQLTPEPFQWLVPGMLRDKLVALIKTLPKQLRKNFVPATNFAEASLPNLQQRDEALLPQFSRQLTRMTGVTIPEQAWDLDALPSHLSMKFRVLDEKGRELLLADDLQQARDRLAGKVKKSFKAQAVGSELERSGITEWDFGPLPEQVEERRDGLTLRGLPTLVDEGDSVALKVIADPREARRQHRGGLRRLFMNALRDKVGYLRKNLPGIQTACLHYAPVGRCDDLKQDILNALFDDLFLVAPLPRDADAFAERCEEGRLKMVDEANRISEQVAQTLAAYHQLAKALKGSLRPDALKIAAEVRAQLDALVAPGFVSRTPARWRDRLPLYIEAARLRLEKGPRNMQRDRENSIAVARLWDDYAQRAESYADGAMPEELIEFRWLLEELRISLFAQELKAVEKVSVKRLQQRWKELLATG